MNIIDHIKKRFATRGDRRRTTGVILHATAGDTADGAESALLASGNSYHYLITKTGSIIKLLPASRRANHAGESIGWDGPNCNDYTIGISFVNRNDGRVPLTEAQYKAAAELIKTLKKQFPTMRYYSTHRIVSPGRKTDPNTFSIMGFDCGLEYWH